MNLENIILGSCHWNLGTSWFPLSETSKRQNGWDWYQVGPWLPGLWSEGTAGPQGTGGDLGVMEHSVQHDCSDGYTLCVFIKTDLHLRDEESMGKKGPHREYNQSVVSEECLMVTGSSYTCRERSIT